MAKRKKQVEENELPKERVTVFGDEWTEKWEKDRDHKDGSVFGIMLIVGGIILLLNTLNIISWSVWNHVWRFWPLLLIFWGIQVILGFSLATRWIVNVIGVILVVLVGLFAVHQANPALLKDLPPIFDQIFAYMKGVQQ